MTTGGVDPAASTITTLMAGELAGLTQDQANIQQGIDLLNTASGGVQQAVGIAQQLEQLAVQASNGTNSGTDSATLQGQVDALLGQLGTLSQSVTYDGLTLLDGTDPWGTSSFISGLTGDANAVSGQYSLSIALVGGSVVLSIVNAGGATVFSATAANPEQNVAVTESPVFTTQTGNSLALAGGWQVSAAQVYDMYPGHESPPSYPDPNGAIYFPADWVSSNTPSNANVNFGPGAAVTDTFTLTQAKTVYLMEPPGNYGTGTTALEVLVNGVSTSLLTFDQNPTSPQTASVFQWEDTLGPGTYSVTFLDPSTSGSMDNVWGLWFGSAAPTDASVTFVDPTAGSGWGSTVTVSFNVQQLVDAAAGTVTVPLTLGSGGFILQTGPANAAADQMGLQLPAVTPRALGLTSLSIATPEAAQAAGPIIQAALQTLTQAQGTLGAQIDALNARDQAVGHMLESLTGSRSTLADANMASVSSAFAAHQVLAQNGLNAVAAADQLPHLLIRLLHV